jgi:hypothetical protein
MSAYRVNNQPPEWGGTNKKRTRHQMAQKALTKKTTAVEVTAPQNLTTDEVAARYRTTAPTVRYWRLIGKGPKSYKVGKRVLYHVDDVETWERQERQRQAREAEAQLGLRGGESR